MMVGVQMEARWFGCKWKHGGWGTNRSMKVGAYKWKHDGLGANGSMVVGVQMEA